MPDETVAAGPVPAAFHSVSGESAASVAIDRIRVRRDFLSANSGIRVPMPPFVLLVKPTALGVSRSGFTVSKKVGNAVARNRARRRLREVARLAMPSLAIPSADHVFIARPQKDETPFEELLDLTRKALTKARRKLDRP
ncbi:ribonuclease P protein component [Sandaracinobacteroides hominis]|uniref:ribonuclease P protein component n=1 Tax=Sandaracinobacteroides hominis TaxID=2780086 RepID=UPI0018F3DD92|nr:ribonuclease P protein component [Sandaracinobacteroides hominis]